MLTLWKYIKMNHPVIITTQTPPKKNKCILQRIHLETPFISPKYIQKQQMHFTETVLYDVVAQKTIKKHPKTAIILIHSQPFLPNARRHLFFQWPSLSSDLVFGCLYCRPCTAHRQCKKHILRYCSNNLLIVKLCKLPLVL